VSALNVIDAHEGVFSLRQAKFCLSSASSFQRYPTSGDGVAQNKMSSNTPNQKVSGPTVAAVPETKGKAEHNLQRLDRLANLGLFSVGIAHEIKNGLVPLHTFVEMLIEKGGDRELAEVVRRELKRIDGLATQMLRFGASRPGTLAPVNVHLLLDHSLRLLDHKIKHGMISARRDYRAAPETVNGDESQLQQAFMNLLFNAIEAMNGGGELTMATESSDGKLKIYIGDTGAGIAPENLAHMFEAFFTTKKHGTGLGLAICRQVVEEHRGTIEVESEPGRGSTFILTLPAA
jgi:signal transduction histidine kinase